jgi:hypothetical protein
MDFVSKVSFVERSRPLGDTSSEQAIRTIKQWTRRCLSQNHRYCATNKRSQLPKQILELTDDVFLLREDMKSEEMYACLSHCWGPKGLTFTWTKDTLKLLIAGMSSAQLSCTFREAVELCLRLDIRYL